MARIVKLTSNALCVGVCVQFSLCALVF